MKSGNQMRKRIKLVVKWRCWLVGKEASYGKIDRVGDADFMSACAQRAGQFVRNGLHVPKLLSHAYHSSHYSLLIFFFFFVIFWKFYLFLISGIYLFFHNGMFPIKQLILPRWPSSLNKIKEKKERKISKC